MSNPLLESSSLPLFDRIQPADVAPAIDTLLARASEALETVGLTGYGERLPSELSGGMARRVALARAIALDPMLIMYDEPFAGLDPISMGVIGQLIRKLNDALGATTLLVTHDENEARAMASRGFRLIAGKLVVLW